MTSRVDDLDKLFDDDEADIDPFDDYDIDLDELEAQGKGNNQAAETQHNDQEGEKQGDGLGVDEEIKIRKRRINVKLDEQRLCSDLGLRELYKTAHKRLGPKAFKGKGHEERDLRKILAFYQLWAHNLFPKGRFEDVITIVEKLGHTKRVQAERMKIIDEVREALQEQQGAEREAAAGTSEAVKSRMENLNSTGEANATGGNGGTSSSTRPMNEDDEDDDHLYSNDGVPRQTAPSTTKANENSMFIMDGDDDNDEGEEDEDDDNLPTQRRRTKPQRNTIIDDEDEDDDLDSLIRDAEQQQAQKDPQPQTRPITTSTNPPQNKRPLADDDDDDNDELDRLIAESEKLEAEREAATMKSLMAKTSETAVRAKASPMKKMPPISSFGERLKRGAAAAEVGKLDFGKGDGSQKSVQGNDYDDFDDDDDNDAMEAMRDMGGDF